MTPEQLYAACVKLAPNFRIGVEYLVAGRSLVWHGRRSDRMDEQSAGLLFPGGSSFEAKFAALLQSALITLQQG